MTEGCRLWAAEPWRISLLVLTTVSYRAHGRLRLINIHGGTRDGRTGGVGGQFQAEAATVVRLFRCLSRRRRRTHISTREGGEELELFKRVPLGGHEVEEHLELAASQETPF